jgi:hypothetical protein
MQEWTEDLSEFTSADVIRSLDENSAWCKRLRAGMSTLVNGRLARHVSLEEYARDRKIGQAFAVECKRRRSLLLHELTRREYHWGC